MWKFSSQKFISFFLKGGEEEGSGDEDEGDNWIVDDNGQPIRKRRKAGGEAMTIEDEQLREAQV